MKYFYKILILMTLLVAPILANAQNQDADFDGDKQGVTLNVNNERIVIHNMPQNGTVEVFNILGSKVTTFSVRNGISNARLSLTKGYYILKIDNTTKKIVIK